MTGKVFDAVIIAIGELMRLRIIFLFVMGFVSIQAGESCPFCDDHVLEKQMFYEGDKVIALVNLLPLLEGHCLVIPKRHVERLEGLENSEVQEIHDTIGKVGRVFKEAFGTSDYLLYVQNGSKAGQIVPHTHYHMVPRTEKRIWTKISLLGKVLQIFTVGRKPLNDDEIKRAVDTMKKAMADVQ